MTETLVVVAVVVLVIWAVRKAYKSPRFRRALNDADIEDVFDLGGGDD